MAFQQFNNGELLNVHRTKLNENFSQAELTGNKTQTISSTPSTTKYPSEKAVADFASKIFLSPSIPASKSGDLLFHTNAPAQTGGIKGKLKYNSSGTLSEFIPDRSVCDYRTASAFASANPVLLNGEIAIESDTKKQKIGNGSSNYSSLEYLIEEPEESFTSGGDNGTGWIKFQNGLIFQYGSNVRHSNFMGNFDMVVTLPISFTTGRVYSHAVLETGTDWSLAQLLVHSRDYGLGEIRFTVDSSFFQSSIYYGLNKDAPYELRWIAVGF